MERLAIPRKFLLIALLPAAIVIAILFYVSYRNNSKEAIAKMWLKIEYSDVVVRKTIEHNHAQKFIWIKGTSGNEFVVADDLNGLWNCTQPGDSIFKKEGDTLVYLKSIYDGKFYAFKYTNRGH